MNTGAISYRVADFLKQHPPFQGMEEADLLILAGRGRVKFHEADEFLCWQGSAFAPYVFVIQQGTVSLWEEANGAEKLRDMLGAGDIVGVERFCGAERYPYSAKSASEVVVYALHAGDFGSMLEKYPQAARYIAAHAASQEYEPREQKRSADQWFVLDILRQQAPLTYPHTATIQEAAQAIHDAGAHAIAITDGRQLVGIVSADDLVQWLARGGGDATSPVTTLTQADPCALAADATVSDCVTELMERDARTAAIVSGGTVQRVLHARDLTSAFGEHPVDLIQHVARAPDTAVLRTLHQRARGFIAEHLANPSALDWLARFSHRFNSSVLRRVIGLLGIADPKSCWCFAGAAGRRELLTAALPSIAVICHEPGESMRAAASLERVHAALGSCGYLPPAQELPPSLAAAHGGEWLERFNGWVRDPILMQTQRSLSFFDMLPVYGAFDLWRELDRHVREIVRSEHAFFPVLANDCLANLPPLTFFQDVVVDETGQRTEIFRLANNALRPLVDVGRVFGLAAGGALGIGTCDRLARARAARPHDEAVFRVAEATTRKVLFHQARIGIRTGTDGSELPPALLSRHDRNELKSCFRAIFDLLAFTEKQEWSA